MSQDRVLISTHDLPLAGELRDGFSEAGYDTDLVTPSERLSASERSVLLVLTGGLGGGGGDLAEQARERLHIPVFAIAEEPVLSPAQRPGFEEVFPQGTEVDDVVLLGSRLDLEA